jgi:hypothetical protein
MRSAKDPIYPIYPGQPTLFEKVAVRLTATAGFCLVCGRPALFTSWEQNLRESGICLFCKSKNRNRQMAYLLTRALNPQHANPFTSLRALLKLPDLKIYNTEAAGPLHDWLARHPGYTCSEYFGPQHKSGEYIHGIRHENLERLSFADDSFDVVLSADVMEHVPCPYQGQAEIYRVLKPGGRHIFTVPFHQRDYFDEVLARRGDGQPELLKPPVYHTNPLQPEGILVYTIFSIEMLLKLRAIGFRTNLYLLRNPFFGILGANGVVFEAIKE